MADAKRILVLCTGNRCRSQMAEGWLRHFGGSDVAASSAGTAPKGVHPRAIDMMAEAGVDISGQTSDHVDTYVDQTFDLIVTVCDNAKEACPIFPNAAQTLHHSFDDPDRPDLPADEQAALFERVRDEIRDWAEALVKGP
jgi:arsenate reductase